MAAPTPSEGPAAYEPRDTPRPATSGGSFRLAPASPVQGGYDRSRDLPRLIPLWPIEITDTSHEGALRLIRRIRRALREERRRGVAGEWCYDLRRHAGLSLALKAELASLGQPVASRSRPLFARPLRDQGK
ncbi:MAG: hypothetical protein ACK5JT_19795 [Hyphomicrobiaceae bacterium]